MLILTRKITQTILIGDDVTVTVLEVKGERVRLGINAPRETPINRQEILDGVSVPNAHPDDRQSS
jgi:carbon storage regulator